MGPTIQLMILSKFPDGCNHIEYEYIENCDPKNSTSPKINGWNLRMMISKAGISGSPEKTFSGEAC